MKRPIPLWLAPTQILGLCVILTLSLRHGGVAGDPGVGWHIAAGEWMLDHREIPAADPFLAPHIDNTWVDTQWLSDIIFALLYRAGGWPVLELMTIAIGWSICLFLLPKLLVRAGVPEPVRMLAVLAAMLLLAVQWFLRPVLFSFLLFALLFQTLARKPEERRDGSEHRLWAIPLLFILWTNLHPAFVLGLLLLAIRLASDLVSRAWSEAKATACILCGSICVTLVNPYGFLLHFQMISLARSRYFQNLNSEWLSPNYAESIFFPHLVVAALLILSVVTFRKRLGFFETLSAVVFLVLSLSGARYLPFLAVPAALYLGRAACLVLGSRTIERFARVYTPSSDFPLAGAALGIMSLVVAFFGAFPGRAAGDSSIAAATKIDVPALIELCSARGARNIFASPDLGGALILSGKGLVHPFIDDRNELNDVARYERYFRIVQGAADWRYALDETGADCVLAAESPFLALISNIRLSNTRLSDNPGRGGKAWKAAGESGKIKVFVLNH